KEGTVDKCKWSMDCSQWVQTVNLVGMMQTMGEDAFDVEMASRGTFRLRVQHSTGLRHRVGWERKVLSDDFTRVVRLGHTGEPEERTEAELLKGSPVGTRLALSTTF